MSENEEKARRLILSMNSNRVIEVNLGQLTAMSGTKGGLLSRKAGGFHASNSDSEDESTTKENDVMSALRETLGASLHSLRRHRAGRIQKWTAAIREAQEDEGHGEAQRTEMRCVLGKLVQAKSSLSALLGRAERFENAFGIVRETQKNASTGRSKLKISINK